MYSSLLGWELDLINTNAQHKESLFFMISRWEKETLSDPCSTYHEIVKRSQKDEKESSSGSNLPKMQMMLKTPLKSTRRKQENLETKVIPFLGASNVFLFSIREKQTFLCTITTLLLPQKFL